jgi:hypothetical protein
LKFFFSFFTQNKKLDANDINDQNSLMQRVAHNRNSVGFGKKYGSGKKYGFGKRRKENIISYKEPRNSQVSYKERDDFFN